MNGVRHRPDSDEDEDLAEQKRVLVRQPENPEPSHYVSIVQMSGRD